VYVIGARGYVKVGVAVDPHRRAAHIQVGCPFKVELHYAHAVPAGHATGIEAFVHRELDSRRTNGEWFKSTPVHQVEALILKAVQDRGLLTDPPIITSQRLKMQAASPLKRKLYARRPGAPEQPRLVSGWDEEPPSPTA